MKYDFDQVVDRRNTNSYKWNVKENELPMWVADMDFPAAPEIRKALQERLDHGVFGYADLPEEWYDAYINWWGRRHGFTIEKDWLLFSTGVLPSLSSIVRKLTTPAENVLVMTPVYNHFFSSILNNGRNALESLLVGGKTCRSADVHDDPLQSAKSGRHHLGSCDLGAYRRTLCQARCACGFR